MPSRCVLAMLAIAMCMGHVVRAADEPDSLLAGQRIAVKSGHPAVVRVLVKDTVAMPTAANDPTLVGARLDVFDTTLGGAGADSYDLPAAGWKGLGNPPGSKGYRYAGGASDPCRVVLLRPTVLKAVCRDGVTLAPPFAGEIGVVLRLGDDAKRYCASFGGSDAKNDAGLTKRFDAPAPASCPSADLGTRTCTFDNTTTLASFLNPALPPAGADGTITVSCGTPGLSGAAPCTCAVGSVAPVVYPSIGEVCILPAAACPSGEIDCDGGDPLGIDLTADHDIGACSGNADCAAACGAVCGGMGATETVRTSGCEGYCRGGTNADAACTATSQCPGGRCIGAGNVGAVVHPGRCNCQCGGTALGPGSAPGAMTCNLGLRYVFENPASGVCGDSGNIGIDTGPLCVPLTSATSVAVLTDANHVSGQTIPTAGAETTNGAPVSCTTFAGGSVTGLRLVGAFGLFDQTTGDLLPRFNIGCE